MCPVPEPPSHTDPRGQPPTGFCSPCYELWKDYPPSRYSAVIFCCCCHEKAAAFLHHSGEWVVLHSISVDEFVREETNYYRDLKSGVTAKLNELLTMQGTIEFLIQETKMEQDSVAPICLVGMPWPPLPSTLALSEMCSMFTKEQVAHLQGLYQFAPASYILPAKEKRFLDYSHPRDKESAYYARLAPLLGLTEEQVERIATQARLEAYGTEDPSLLPEPDPEQEEEERAWEEMNWYAALLEDHVRKVIEVAGESRETVEGLFSALSAYAEQISKLVLTLRELSVRELLEEKYGECYFRAPRG